MAFLLSSEVKKFAKEVETIVLDYRDFVQK